MSKTIREEAMSKSNGGTAGAIRREIGSETNRRFLRSLPAFKADGQIPARLQELLSRLEQVESGNSRPEGSMG